MRSSNIIFRVIFFTTVVAVGVVCLLLLNNTKKNKESIGSSTETRPIVVVEVKQESQQSMKDAKNKQGSEFVKVASLDKIQGADLGGLDEEAVKYYSKNAEYMLDNPVHPGRAKIQQQIRNETPQETFANLTNNDNFAMLMPVMAGFPLSPGNYESDVIMVTKMVRVRKLLADALDDPAEISGFLKQEIMNLSEKYPDQMSEYSKKLGEDGSYGHYWQNLPDHIKTRILCTTGVYILSQIDSPYSLSILLKLLELPENSRPVNDKFLFYAIYNVVHDHLEIEKSEDEEQYLEKLKSLKIPIPRKEYVTAWNAYYDEDDFRRILPGNKIDMSMQPKIQITRFPISEQLNSSRVKLLLNDLKRISKI